jgi:PIN domain nuclease of toxin-antitoxin system
MKYLIDTNVLIWYSENSSKISNSIYDVINNPQNKIFVSIVSLWELAIKLNLGKIKITDSFVDFISNYITKNTIDILEISVSHLLRISTLENFHRDPFDRMIISQSLAEDIIVISSDEKFDLYKIKRIF